jgi:23S rRNA (adenine2030-N6)-methyltransferase
MLWLPVKDRPQIQNFERKLRQVALTKVLWAELRIAPVVADGPLTATALVLVNPPYGLSDALTVLLPFLAARLISAPGGGWELREI